MARHWYFLAKGFVTGSGDYMKNRLVQIGPFESEEDLKTVARFITSPNADDPTSHYDLISLPWSVEE